MNKIETLIQQLCPNGVEFRELGEVIEIYTGTQFNKSEMQEVGEFPCMNGGIGVSGYTDKWNESENTITISQGGASAGYVNWILSKFWAGAHCYVIRPTSKELDKRYLYFFLKNMETKIMELKHGAGIPGLNREKIKSLQIPIPPLPVQQEIVNILDKFTSLEAELEAELEARRTQYEHYQNQLLTVNDKCLMSKSLGEIGTLVRGNGLQKKDFTESGVGCIHYGQIYTYYGTFTDKTKSFVLPDLAEKLQKVEKGDLIIANTGENVEDICKTVAWLGDETIVTGGHSTIFKHKQNPKYLAYYFQTKDFFDQKRKVAKGTKVIEVAPKDLEKIKIPIPPIEEQNRIVAILDEFDALVNDISVGLPAEIKMRRQQYEYYRNKLLTFKAAV
ncbi:MAG: restriction endonuclease subunit S [Bacteroidales bacterium]|jgi:type I restriction enzyme S subunit|nr:restriction endonuclease subunit S [Bacteroidales bacterium]